MAGLRLPRLEMAVDCGSLGYEGLRVVFWLNPPLEEWVPPWEDVPDDGEAAEVREVVLAERPWERPFYHGLARQIERVEIPGRLTVDGEPEVIGVADAEALWRLERRENFDPQILVFASAQYSRLRNERLQEALKN